MINNLMTVNAMSIGGYCQYCNECGPNGDGVFGPSADFQIGAQPTALRLLETVVARIVVIIISRRPILNIGRLTMPHA